MRSHVVISTWGWFTFLVLVNRRYLTTCKKLLIRDCLFSLLSCYLCFLLLLHHLSANDLASYFNEKMEAFRRDFPEITITTLGILSLLVPTYYTFLWSLVIGSMFLYKINSTASMLPSLPSFLFRVICPAILFSLFNISNYFSSFHIIVITIKICYYFFHVKSFLCPWNLLSFSLLTLTPYFCSILQKNFSFIYSCIFYFLSLLFFLNLLQSGICLSHCTETVFIKGINVSHCEIQGSKGQCLKFILHDLLNTMVIYQCSWYLICFLHMVQLFTSSSYI